jgi:hypothetical protein
MLPIHDILRRLPRKQKGYVLLRDAGHEVAIKRETLAKLRALKKPALVAWLSPRALHIRWGAAGGLNLLAQSTGPNDLVTAL